MAGEKNAMDILLSKENLEFREQARAIADEVVRPVAAELDRENADGWAIPVFTEAGDLHP